MKRTNNKPIHVEEYGNRNGTWFLTEQAIARLTKKYGDEWYNRDEFSLEPENSNCWLFGNRVYTKMEYSLGGGRYRTDETIYYCKILPAPDGMHEMLPGVVYEIAQRVPRAVRELL